MKSFKLFETDFVLNSKHCDNEVVYYYYIANKKLYYLSKNCVDWTLGYLVFYVNRKTKKVTTYFLCGYFFTNFNDILKISSSLEEIKKVRETIKLLK